jgi:hypothetical protein
MDVDEAGLASEAEESWGDMYGMDVGEVEANEALHLHPVVYL